MRLSYANGLCVLVVSVGGGGGCCESAVVVLASVPDVEVDAVSAGAERVTFSIEGVAVPTVSITIGGTALTMPPVSVGRVLRVGGAVPPVAIPGVPAG